MTPAITKAKPFESHVPTGGFTVVELTPKQEQEWDKTRSRFMLSCPAFAHVWYTMMVRRQGGPVAMFTRDVPIAATDGVNLILNPDTFFGNYTLNQRVFIIAHEILHNIYDHMGVMHRAKHTGKIAYPDGKRLDYQHQLMNVAADLVINDLLIQSQVGVFPQDGLHDTNYGTGQDAVIDVYRKVYQDAQKGGGKGQGPGGGKAGFDQHLEPGQGDGKDPGQAQSERSPQEWATAVAAGIASARAQGKLPAALERALGNLLDPQVPWNEHIAALFARKVGSGSYDWRRPDRRFIVRDDPFYAPGRSGFGAECVVVGVDTSGSIGQTELDIFFCEMAGILEEVKPRRLVVMWCDAKVHRVDEIESASDLPTLKRKGAPGGGGTDFRPVFTEIGKMGLTPDALVYLTDGYGSFPDAEPKYPVIWADITGKRDHYTKWGDYVHVPIREKK